MPKEAPLTAKQEKNPDAKRRLAVVGGVMFLAETLIAGILGVRHKAKKWPPVSKEPRTADFVAAGPQDRMHIFLNTYRDTLAEIKTIKADTYDEDEVPDILAHINKKIIEVNVELGRFKNEIRSSEGPYTLLNGITTDEKRKDKTINEIDALPPIRELTPRDITIESAGL